MTFNARSGQVKAECGLFDERELSYPEALIAFSKLSSDFKAMYPSDGFASLIRFIPAATAV